MQRLRLALGCVVFLAGASAHAATVVIARPSTPSAEVAQALTLLRGELLSVGLEVTLAERRSAGATSLPWLESLAAQGASAVIETVGDDALEAIDVWIVKTDPQRFQLTHLAVEPEAARRPEVLALRALEALRAGLLQIDWAARKRRTEPVATAPALATSAADRAPPPEPQDRLGVEAGAVATMSTDGLGPALLPTARLTWAARPWLLAQAAVAGLGTRSAVNTTAGSAQVRQQYVLVGGYYRWHADRRVWPILGVAGGALHTTIEGQSGPDTVGHTDERWSVLLDSALGAGFRVGGRYYLTLAAHAQVAWPYVAIHIVDQMGGSVGRPSLLLSLTAGAWL